MAIGDMFLRVEGKSTGAIKGETADKRHVDAIDVLEWSWGMKGSSTLSGAGAGAKAALSELRVTKSVDRASTALMSVMRNNEVVKKAVLSVRKAGGISPVDYLTITIERGRITNLDLGTVAPGRPELVERLTFSFEKITVEYASQDATGARTAASSFNAEITAT